MGDCSTCNLPLLNVMPSNKRLTEVNCKMLFYNFNLGFLLPVITLLFINLGISLLPDQWNQLKEMIPDIDDALKKL